MALIKYWGKRDEALMLPANSSLSMTLDAFYSTTTVDFQPGLTRDEFDLDGSEAEEADRSKVAHFLDHVRALTETRRHAIVTSANHVPTAAGLASSASGFAALAAAATRALGHELDGASLSRLARRGSGSACRSIYGGFVQWRKGQQPDGLDSYSVPVAPMDHWEINMLIACVAAQKKAVSSRDGMRRTVATSPFYAAWVTAAEADLVIARQAILARDFEALGRVAEANALKMHATTLGADPPFTYWHEATLAVMRTVQALRAEGIAAYFTLDAGANIAILCEPASAATIRAAILAVSGVRDVVLCKPGPGVTVAPEVVR
jgi:diphosphomevalonate decarboxylase